MYKKGKILLPNGLESQILLRMSTVATADPHCPELHFLTQVLKNDGWITQRIVYYGTEFLQALIILNWLVTHFLSGYKEMLQSIRTAQYIECKNKNILRGVQKQNQLFQQERSISSLKSIIQVPLLVQLVNCSQITADTSKMMTFQRARDSLALSTMVFSSINAFTRCTSSTCVHINSKIILYLITSQGKRSLM